MPLIAPIVILALTMAAEIVVLASGDGVVRMVLVGGFLAFAPGAAALRPLQLPLQSLAWAGFAVTLSLAITGIVAGSLLYLGAWSGELGVTILALIVVVLTLVDLPTVRSGARALVRMLGSQQERGS
ncbi:MAG: hypothetical protein K5924_06410 [Chloroflexi bacterium]|nr:hypothetical protein [Chloroflexota bacterium]